MVISIDQSALRLLRIPIIGRMMARNQVSRELKSRNDNDFTAAWSCISVDRGAVEKICDIVRDKLNWPSHFFLPGDNCAALFIEPFGTMATAEVIMFFSDQGYAESSSILKSSTSSFGDLVLKLMEARTVGES